MAKETEYGYESDLVEVSPGFRIKVYTPKFFAEVCRFCKTSMMHDKTKKLEGFPPSYFCSDECRVKEKEARDATIKWMEETNFVQKLKEEMIRIAEKYPLVDP